MTEPGPEENPAKDPEISALGGEQRAAWATLLFGVVLVVAAVLVVFDALRLPATSAVVGPAAVPLPVGALLGLVGVGLSVQAWLRLRTAMPGHPVRTHAGWWVLALIAALVAFPLLLPVLGYVITSAGLFVAAALLLGAPRRWAILGYGWVLAAIVFLIFDRLIGLTLPTGPWGF